MGKEMSSGAYALFVDQPAGAGPNASIQRVIPLIPVNHQGGISFNNGWLSLAYDNFGTGPATVNVSVRVINGQGAVTLSETLSIGVGRTTIKQLTSGDHAASLTVAGPAGARPALTALVSSYITPKARKGVSSAIEGRGLLAVAPIAADELVAIKGGHIVTTAALRSLPERLQNSEVQIAGGFHLAAVEDAEYEPVMLFINHWAPNVASRALAAAPVMVSAMPLIRT
jgi:hypothetical protein